MVPLLDIAAPDPHLIRILAALGVAADCPGIKFSYSIIPGNDGPRWLLPNRNELTQTILREWRPYSAAARLSWAGIRLLARLGALRLLPGTRQTQLPATVGRHLLSQFGIEGDAFPPVILVGNPSATRKIIVFLADPTQGLNTVLKLPLTLAARVSIRNEAETLRKLDGLHRAPRLLHYSEQSGAAMQEYLPGKLGSRRCKPDYLRLMIEFARTGEVASLREHGLRLAERLRSHAAYRDHAGDLDSGLASLLKDTAIPAALVHGDFAPWNIRELSGGSCTLVDWESAVWRGLPLHDLCHFFYMQTQLFSPNRLFYSTLLREGSWRKYCHALDLSPSMVPRLVAAFLLETLARCWEAGNAPSADFCLRQLQAFQRQARNAAV
jgi:hypothetical protein